MRPSVRGRIAGGLTPGTLKTQEAAMAIMIKTDDSSDKRKYRARFLARRQQAWMSAPEPTSPAPTMDEVIAWESEGYCEATDGCSIEPDGTCEHGHPSWMLYFGLI